MKKKLIIAQDIKEFKYVYNNLKEKDYYECLPLDLETQIYCDLNKIPYINLSKHSNNSLHKKIQDKVKIIIKSNKVSLFKLISIKKTYIQWLEYKSTSVLFLYYFINLLNKKKNITLITSGWETNDIIPLEHCYCLTKILKVIFPEINLITIDSPSNNKKKYKNKIFFYKILTNLPKKNKEQKLIFFTNLSYNLKKFIFNILKKNHKLLLFPNKINLFKKILLFFLNIYFIELKRENKFIISKGNLKKIYFNNKNISESIYHNEEKVINYFFNLESKVNSFKKFFKNTKVDLIISNNAIGIDGGISEIASNYNIKTFNIPHGTVSEYFNKGGKIFNLNVSQAIFSNFAVNAIQSKISNQFIKKFKIKKKLTIKTGNLIFNHQAENNGNKILYAETNKNFFNYRTFGFQTYYEYLENLEILNRMAFEKEFKIVVKPHPNIFSSINLLEKKFKHLYFTKKNINKLFKEIKLIISYSSSMIEDGLHSMIPIILFDRHNRYKHCKSNINVRAKNFPLYYVNNEKNLALCISTLLNSKSINFYKYIDSTNSSLNFDKVLYKLL